MMLAYRTLEQRFARRSAVTDAIGILSWDKETMMPLGAAEGRSEQLATLEVLAHEMLTAPEIGDLLSEAEQQTGELEDWQRGNLAEMRRLHIHATAVPANLVERSSKAATRCEIAWRKARAESDFAGLLPLLSEVVLCERETGQAKGEALGLAPYDALMDGYDPGARQADIDPLFAELRDALPALIEAAVGRQSRNPPLPPLEGPFPQEVQRGLAQHLMTLVGVDTQRGRLDVSTHPFCGGATDDMRITTRYDEADFSSALMGVLHESGHALYEQGRARRWLHQPVGSARGMSMHESQSLLIEMQVCRSRAFAEYLAPLIGQSFGPAGAPWNAEALHRLFLQVKPDFIRVDADEITYPAHVIIRYEIEKAVIGGEMPLSDLPSVFNAGVRELLGLNVPEDRLGCLQDIHWFCGAWGYFPTYTLGAMIAAQLFEAACEAEPDIPSCIRRGDFAPLLGWLRENVHEVGSSLPAGQILTCATGRPLDAAVFRAHLSRRYLEDG